MPAPFEIVLQADGSRVAGNGLGTLSVLGDIEPNAQVFRRRAVKNVGTEAAHQVEWAVADVAGLRVYFDGQNVVVTKQDLMP